MTCFCHKLRARQFPLITELETSLLRAWVSWAESTDLLRTSREQHREHIEVRRGRRKFASTPANNRPLGVLHTAQKQVTALFNTYQPNLTDLAVGTQGDNWLRLQQSGGQVHPLVNIFNAFNRKDQTLALRTGCYGLALLHPKNTSTTWIVQEIQNALQSSQSVIKDIKDKVRHIIRVGRRWEAIIEEFASIATCSSPVPLQARDVRGLLCLLESASLWERVNPEVYHRALERLCSTTDICKRASKYTPYVQQFLDEIHLAHSFVDESNRAILLSPSSLDVANMSSSSRNTRGHPAHSSETDEIETRAEANSLPSDSTPAAAFGAVLEGVSGSQDAKTLLLLLSFLSTADKISLDLFCGAANRQRWSARGDIEPLNAAHIGISHDLQSLLFDSRRLSSSFHELCTLPVLQRNDDGTFTLDATVPCRVHATLSEENILLWRRQALVVVYSAISWKYINAPTLSSKLALPHLKHILEAFEGRYEKLDGNIRTDLTLTLVEASRFPNMAWKRFAVREAELASRGLEDYPKYCVAASQSMLSRIAGSMEHATSSIDKRDWITAERTNERRMHSAVGQATIQRALNCIQEEDLSAAQSLLHGWDPMGVEPSPCEQVIVFRKHVLLGKILRWGGAFQDSFTQLELARHITLQCPQLTFDEDLGDLACARADTLLERGHSVAAANDLETELARTENTIASSGKSLVEVCLAEALFAQRRYQEAEQLCQKLQTRRGLLKFEKLRLHVTMAKICHSQRDHQGARSWWFEALKDIGKFQMTNGVATRIILLSIFDTLGDSGDEGQLKTRTMQQIAELDATAKPGGTLYWIAGMRQWREYLETRNLRSRM